MSSPVFDACIADGIDTATCTELAADPIFDPQNPDPFDLQQELNTANMGLGTDTLTTPPFGFSTGTSNPIPPTSGGVPVPHEFVEAVGGLAVNVATSPLGQAIILNQLGIETGGAVPVPQVFLPQGGFGGAIPQNVLSFSGNQPLQVPGIDVPFVDFGLANAPCIRPNSSTGRYPSEVTFVDPGGKIRSYTNRGRPILWSRDRSTAARTNRLLGGRVTKSGVTRSRRARTPAPPAVVCAVCNGSSHA